MNTNIDSDTKTGEAFVVKRQIEISKAFDKIKDELESLPNHPEKIFKNYGLTVHQIQVDEISGSGYKTSFSYLGKKYSRPELVAKAFYESQGFKVSWSEGVAWDLAIRCLLDALTNDCPKHLKLVEGKLSNNKNISNQSSSPEYAELMQNLLASKARYENDIASSGTISRSTLLQYIESALRVDSDELEELHKIKTNRASDYDVILSTPLNEFRIEARNIVHKLANTQDRASIISRLPTPPAEKKSHFSGDRNLNEWSILFARELLESMDWSKLLDLYFDKGLYILNPFDLTVVDTTNSEVKFVEVKFKDKFTANQFDYLAGAIASKINVELVVVSE
ncbi:hypothetical protein [Acidovorax sp.]|uniref:hypothetical protein n=1 Tax=Acidovorax sp. TaxID=1872122 RepID=UPI0027BB0AEC|nr:hypothetical protein [Acidovorax sp.]